MGGRDMGFVEFVFWCLFAIFAGIFLIVMALSSEDRSRRDACEKKGGRIRTISRTYPTTTVIGQDGKRTVVNTPHTEEGEICQEQGK